MSPVEQPRAVATALREWFTWGPDGFAHNIYTKGSQRQWLQQS